MKTGLRYFSFAILTAAVVWWAPPAHGKDGGSEVWTFDRLDKIGGMKPEVLGQPHVIKSEVGKATQFDGKADGLLFPKHPLAGAEAFTFEVIFRPEKGGAEEQRWFHLAENPATGEQTETRYLFELRIVGDQWCLESFVRAPGGGKALIDRQKLHPLDTWYRVAMVYDGKELRSYVDGELQGKGDTHFTPSGPGRTSVGVRVNKVFFFKGSVRQARFTRKALEPEQFLKIPAQRKSGQ